MLSVEVYCCFMKADGWMENTVMSANMFLAHCLFVFFFSHVAYRCSGQLLDTFVFWQTFNKMNPVM